MDTRRPTRLPTRSLGFPLSQLLVPLAVVALPASAAGNPWETPAAQNPPRHTADREAADAQDENPGRMDWWRNARFGMFIHWGLYAIPAGEWNGRDVPGVGEWIMFHGQIPPADYEPLAKQFNPVRFDARRWVEIARNAGMKYIVITSKHHDGFCLWDSAETEYDVIDATPFGRDILAELAEECRRQGVKLCFYHSILDWHHPDYLPRREWDPRPADDADFEQYVQHLRAQVRELVTRYDPAVMWFDGEWESTWTHAHGRALYDLVRSLKPDVIVNNRVDKGRQGMAGLTREGGFAGDFGTPEQEVPGTGLPGVDWETCMTMNDTWGFKRSDENWKSTETLVRTLIDVASKGGNFLLNVGPTAKGEIPAPSVERLAAIGRWLNANGEAIYGTTASPFRIMPFDGRCTVKDDKLFLHVFDRPEDGTLRLTGVRNRVRGARLLTGNATLPVKQDGEEVQIRLPDAGLDPIATVVAVQLDGQPDIDTEYVLRAGPDGVIELPARYAEVHGATARYESGHGKDNIGFWIDSNDWVSWPIEVERGGGYRVELTQATPDDTAGSRFAIEIGGQRLEGRVAATGSWTEFRKMEPGEVTLEPGRQQLAVRVLEKPGFAVMNLKAVVLRPIEP